MTTFYIILEIISAAGVTYMAIQLDKWLNEDNSEDEEISMTKEVRRKFPQTIDWNKFNEL